MSNPETLEETVRRFFGDGAELELRFLLAPELDALGPKDYKPIRDTLYPTRGIYFGDVVVQDDLLHDESQGVDFLLNRRTFLIIKKAERLASFIEIRNVRCPLYEIRDRRRPGRELRLPSPRSDEDEKTPIEPIVELRKPPAR